MFLKYSNLRTQQYSNIISSIIRTFITLIIQAEMFNSINRTQLKIKLNSKKKPIGQKIFQDKSMNSISTNTLKNITLTNKVRSKCKSINKQNANQTKENASEKKEKMFQIKQTKVFVSKSRNQENKKLQKQVTKSRKNSQIQKISSLNIQVCNTLKVQNSKDMPKLIIKTKRPNKTAFYYYISQIQRDLKNKDEENESLFVNHLLLSLSIYKSHKYTYAPTQPNCKVILPKVQQQNLGLKSSQKFKNLCSKKKKIIIFDVDQTLIHSSVSSQQNSTSYFDQHQIIVKRIPFKNNKNIHKNQKLLDLNQKSQCELQTNFEGRIKNLPLNIGADTQKFNTIPCKKSIFTINIRPYTRQVLKRLSQKFTLGIFTAAQQPYADQILKLLDPNNKIFSFRLFRQHCTVLAQSSIFPNIEQIVKDLRVIPKIDLSKTIIIDNSPLSYLFNHQNGIPIVPFTSDCEDDQLLKLESFINNYLVECQDVRKIIKQYFRTKDYVKYQSVKDIVDKLFKFKDFI